MFDPTLTPAALIQRIEPVDNDELAALRDYLTNPIAAHRAMSAAALGLLGRDEDAPALIHLLADESLAVQAAAASSLAGYVDRMNILLPILLATPCSGSQCDVVANLIVKAGPSVILPVAVAQRERANANADLCARVLAGFERAQLIEEYLKPGIEHSFTGTARHETHVSIFEAGVSMVASNRTELQGYWDRICCMLWCCPFNHPDYEAVAASRLSYPPNDFDPVRANCPKREAAGEARAKRAEKAAEEKIDRYMKSIARGPRLPSDESGPYGAGATATPRPEEVDGLIGQLRSPDANTKGRAAEALGRAGDSQAIEPLLKLFRSELKPEAVEEEYQTEQPVYDSTPVVLPKQPGIWVTDTSTRFGSRFVPGRFEHTYGMDGFYESRFVPDPTPFIPSPTPTPNFNRRVIGKTVVTRTRSDTSADRDAIDRSRASAIRALVKLGGVSFRDVQNFWNNGTAAQTPRPPTHGLTMSRS
jgi:HEAT repeat protein